MSLRLLSHIPGFACRASPVTSVWCIWVLQDYKNYLWIGNTGTSPQSTTTSSVYVTGCTLWHVLNSAYIQYTVRCRYNAVNFITNIHKRHPMARPLGRGMGCLLWIQHLIDIMSQFLQLLMQNLTILDRVITALDCTSKSKGITIITDKQCIFHTSVYTYKHTHILMYS